MALRINLGDKEFGVGDTIRVIQKIKEGEKTRLQAFEGIVIAIKNRAQGKTFTVRRIGAQRIGIERIFPVQSPLIEDVEIVRKGTEGVRQAKIYYIRKKSRRELEEIYSRAAKKNQPVKKAAKKVRKSSKKTAKTA